MKTLVIHPKDSTTDFLMEIYARKNWKVVNTNLPQDKLKELIIAHDRIVMLGHGCDAGLIGFNSFIINISFANVLKDKECVCIWCNSDLFVLELDLKGFYTGMIISEMSETEAYNIDATFDQINESNILFSTSIEKSIDFANSVNLVKEIYKNKTNPVIKFNRERLYYR